MSATPVIAANLPRRPAIAIWAAFGLGLAVFSYLFTIALAAACGAGSFYLVQFALPGTPESHVHGQIIILLLVGALTLLIMGITLLWSLIPSRTKLETPPRVTLAPERHPRLSAEILRIAQDLGEKMPARIFLDLQMNASVEQVGGNLGLGGERVLSLGLPLLAILNVTEFRAILAHEFAHYYGGDTRLCRMVRASVLAMTRTLENTSSQSSLIDALPRNLAFFGARLAHGAVVGIMKLYWHFLLSVEQSISREQEYRADEIACAAAGSKALIEALRKIHAGAFAWTNYYLFETMPAVELGCRMPIAEGLARYAATETNVLQASECLQEAMQKTKAGMFDSHPPLSRRIAAAEELSAYAPSVDREDMPASRLLDELDAMEVELCKQAWKDVPVERLRVAPWERSLAEIFIPGWRAEIDIYAEALRTETVGSMPQLVVNSKQIRDRVPNPKGVILDVEQRILKAWSILGRALTITLIDNGWEPVHGTEQVMVRRGGVTLQPYDLIEGLRSRQLDANAWTDLCSKHGIGALRLGVKAG